MGQGLSLRPADLREAVNPNLTTGFSKPTVVYPFTWRFLRISLPVPNEPATHIGAMIKTIFHAIS